MDRLLGIHRIGFSKGYHSFQRHQVHGSAPSECWHGNGDERAGSDLGIGLTCRRFMGFSERACA